MDINPTVAHTHEPETETRTTPFTNGVLKRRHAAPLHLHHHPVVVTYKECLKNHAAATGGHSVDGCGEFMPSPTSNPSDPSSFRCAACGCHRNFHRRDHDASAAHTPPALEYHPYHRHLPPPPRVSPNNSPSLSPPPISSAYPRGFSLSLNQQGHHHEQQQQRRDSASGSGHVAGIGFNGTRKRCRTKFTQHQKVKMLELAERIGWKMQKRDEDLIMKFCNEIGVERWVFKVWMHNNKNTTSSSKKDQPCSSNVDNCNNRNDGVNGNDQETKDIHIHPQQLQLESVHDDDNVSEHGVGLN